MADTQNVYEQLEELKQKLNEANKPRTLVEKLANDGPEMIEFVKNANRVWRYRGEHSDFNRDLKKLKKGGIIHLLLLSLQIALPFLFVSAIPYTWILVAINSILCLGYGAYIGYKIFRKREYEMPYDLPCGFGQYNEYDDNGIIKSTENGILLRTFKIITAVIMPIIMVAISMWLFLGLSESFIPYILCLVFAVLAISFFCGFDSAMDYTLYFVDDKNEIPYQFLKDFMKRNKLK